MRLKTRTPPAQLKILPGRRESAGHRAHREPSSLKVVGLFAGIGGIELGLRRAGHDSLLLCEIDEWAGAVLDAQFPGIPRHRDVCTLTEWPKGTDLVAAGFPCQDLSQAGKTAGISGLRSGLVGEVFRVLEDQPVSWLLLENVPFMLQLGRGRALEVIVGELERLKYRWAYRVVDARAFGIPQRRERVFLLASRNHDPRTVLFADDVGEPAIETWGPGRAFGFYWTEGIRGLGAAVDAIPTLKGGSTIGIPSAPAILLSDGTVVTPDIRDAERLQGFPEGWTAPVETVTRKGRRWKLVGNAVCVEVAAWIGRRLITPREYDGANDEILHPGRSWPRAAWNLGEGRRIAPVSAWPTRITSKGIEKFLRYPGHPLSVKATEGFLSRAATSSLRFPSGFLPALERHLRRMKRATRSPSETRALAVG
jgi:DNA (cytosine-5)-methyltransferase 1